VNLCGRNTDKRVLLTCRITCLPGSILGTAGLPGSEASPLVKILIVDDHEYIRRMVRVLLEAEDGWRVCGEAADGQQAIDQSELLKPDVVILDIHMPILNGFDASRQILLRSPQILILILTTDESPHFARAAAMCGAPGFLSKAHATDQLVPAISSLLRGKKYFVTAEAS
jgi:DNA-binding NarL/FixJ family response regulator